jgi:hypothetical protein
MLALFNSDSIVSSNYIILLGCWIPYLITEIAQLILSYTGQDLQSDLNILFISIQTLHILILILFFLIGADRILIKKFPCN